MAELTGWTDLAYGAHERQKIDLFRPAGAKAAPLVLLIHGGGWSGGDRKQYLRSIVPLAEAGFAAASIGYRLLPDAAWPEMPHDVLRAAAWLHEKSADYGIDARKAVTLGSSAGGHLALCLQAWRDKWLDDGVVKAAPQIVGTVAQCPVVDFTEGLRPAWTKLMGNHAADELCPMRMAAGLFRSVLVIQGDADTTTPIESARQFVVRLRTGGAEARMEVLRGAEHAFGYDTRSEHGAAALALAIAYLKEKLLPKRSR